MKVHKRSLLADSDASTLIHFNAPEMTSELRAQAFQLASSVSLPPRPALAYKRSLGRVLLGSGDDGSSSKSSAWPPTVTLWPTAAGNASCYPFGVNQLCVFPGNVKMTQADWMFTCWDAGLQPFGIYTYSQLYMLTWGSQIVNVPVGTVRSIVSQVSAIERGWVAEVNRVGHVENFGEFHSWCISSSYLYESIPVSCGKQYFVV